MSRVVVFTPDVVGERMAGPGIRAYHLASELARHVPTTLIAQLDQFDGAIPAVDRQHGEARSLLRNATVVIGQPTRELLNLDGRRQKIIFDLFDPVVLELRELYAERATLRDRVHLQREWGRLHAALRRGHRLIAATARQRDFYTGVYAIRNGAPGSEWQDRWIEVPFGVEEMDAGPERELPADPPLILWGGGIWPWLDPETAIAAVRNLNETGVPCRLLFLGGSRPNAELSRVGNGDRLRELIRLSGEHVTMNDEWVPYRSRARWLRSAKIAIMLHRKTLEAEYSIRTRLFDAIWCSVPIVATTGGFAAELVEREGVGVVVEPSNIAAVAGGIKTLLRNDAFYAQSVSNLDRIREKYRWSVVTQPLIHAVQRWIG